MTEQENSIAPTEINFHQKSRLLELVFSDGFKFKYPAEYLRVYSTSAEVKTMDKPVHGKELVNISSMEPQGSYALKINFDDGHDTAIYSWSTLHELGVNYEVNWAKYLKDLAAHNLKRGEGRVVGEDGKVSIKLVYFIELAKISGKDEEEVVIPDVVTNVETLLKWMRMRGLRWEEAFADDRVQVTVNKQFAEPYTLVEHGDEVAFVPRPKF
ncbi:MAG: gamma-butyrobetaine hydroxylase-like domain-containing protein [Gammaproteobacteria bacterium]|nr:gamma-butyrobetaine hydroxylase-like domain-containing protein [Gammaproteobacteria bacterium]MCW8923756.1 gamma-butyrobetaine hydroxylase-like domain-containing protein [Gammaproteobacteria bacterium]